MKYHLTLFAILLFAANFLTFQANAAPEQDLAAAISQIESDTVPAGPFSADVVVCDQYRHKILILKAGEDWSKPESVVWEWSASMSPQIRSPFRRSIGKT